MLTQAISGLVALIVAIFLGPAIFTAAFQMMTGQKVNLSGYTRGVSKLFGRIWKALLSACDSIGKAVASKVPNSHKGWRPLVQVLVKFGMLILAVYFLLLGLASLVPDRPSVPSQDGKRPPPNHYQPPPRHSTPGSDAPEPWIPPYKRAPGQP